jgi:chaperonin GroEL
MKKEIYFDEDLRKKWLAGAEKMARAVGSTMGPCGRFFAMAGMRAPVITKDGVSVSKDIDLEDPVENSGAQLMREIALRTNDVAGDGTTTSIVFGFELVKEGYKAIEAGYKPIGLKRGMDAAVLRCHPSVQWAKW